jgi:predicted nucleic acid-binding protein
MRYFLDTNILLHYLRASQLSKHIDENYNPLSIENDAIISIVSVGELRSIARMNHWGDRKLEQLDELIAELIVVDINTEDVVERYAEIDAFSNGKLRERPLGMSARNMGKNDLWIAATASLLNATLLTTDADFDHLHQQYLNIICLRI